MLNSYNQAASRPAKVKKKLASMTNGDRNFWNLTKEIAGLDTSKGSATPSVDDLADHFAEKMSNGEGVTEDDFKPTNDFQVKMTGFKIKFKRVKTVLSHLDTSKSANGVGNLFLRECAVELAPAMTKLFKYIVTS